MPKQKTRKSITKRFRITGTGKVMRRHSFARHLSSKKSKSRLRRLGKQVVTNPIYARKIKKALGKRKGKK